MTLRPLTPAEWADAAAAPGAPLACRPVWARAVARQPGWEARAWRLEAADGVWLVVGQVDRTRRWPALQLSPLGISCGVQDLTGGRAAARGIEAFLRATRGRFRAVSFALPPGSAGPDVSGEMTPTHTHILELDEPWETLFERRLRGATRTCLRRAEAVGVEVEVTSRVEDVEAYGSLHARAAARAGGYGEGTPFELVREAVRECAGCELLLARVEGRLAAGAVFLRDGDTVFYWHAAIDRELALAQPGYAVLARAIRRAQQAGARAFNFGGSLGITSLERFKESWGARPVAGVAGTWRHPLVHGLRRARSMRGLLAGGVGA